jgi:hypothetical protein
MSAELLSSTATTRRARLPRYPHMMDGFVSDHECSFPAFDDTFHMDAHVHTIITKVATA